MSVVLQSLIHNPLVRNFYLSDGHRQKDCTRTNCMSCAMDEVFSEFFASDKLDGFGPVNLLTTSWKCEQVYSPGTLYGFVRSLQSPGLGGLSTTRRTRISPVPPQPTPHHQPPSGQRKYTITATITAASCGRLHLHHPSFILRETPERCDMYQLWKYHHGP